jgi:hypothetical protein
LSRRTITSFVGVADLTGVHCDRPSSPPGETSRFAIDQLPLGVKRVSVGRFYFIPHPLMYYYFAAIQGEKVHWHLIESFQSGEKLTATLTQGHQVLAALGASSQ